MFDKILKFEKELAEFTGAPYAIMTDCCTHAIELCLRYDSAKKCIPDVVNFTAYTYLSVPMTFRKLNIPYQHIDEKWIGEYQFHGTRIWDSARRLEHNMYREGQLQCVSFGHKKPLHISSGGAILLDDAEAYHIMLAQRYDGRYLDISPWKDQKIFQIGYHYSPSIEEAEIGSVKLAELKIDRPIPVYVEYPDLREITIC